MNPLVSIVILNWNGRKYLEEFLPSVWASTYDHFECVVIDNNSTDDSVDYLLQYQRQVRVVQLPRNLGFAGGYNEGLKQVTTPYYILLNSDVEVQPGWIEPMLDLLERDPKIAACQPKILQYRQRDLFEYAGAAGGWLDYLGYPFARGRIFDVCEKDEGQYDTAEPIFWASGAAMFIRREAFWEVGGFDGFFFAHQEEIDLCWRLQLAGYTIMACPASTVYHVGGGTLPKGNARKVFLNFRNNLVMMAKNLPAGEAFLKIFWRVWLDALSAGKSLFTGEATYAWAILKAHLAFLDWLFFKRRLSVFPRRREGILRGYCHQSVVWRHFVRGKKKFSEIISHKS